MTKPALLLTAVLLAMPTRAVAATPSVESPARVRVVVDADDLGADAEAFFEKEASTKVGAAIEQVCYAVTDQVDADVTVRLRMSFYNAEDLDYEIDVDISAGAELVQLETVACPQCVDADLLGRVDALGDDVAGGIARALAAARDHDGAGGEPVGERDEVAVIGAVGIVGGVIAGLGVGATIAGVVELSRGKVFDDPTQIPGRRTYVDNRPIGGALLGAGLVAVTAGTAMLVVDLVKRSKARKRGHDQAGAAFPLFSPGLIGLGYSQTF